MGEVIEAKGKTMAELEAEMISKVRFPFLK